MKLTKHEIRLLIKEHIAIRDFLEIQYKNINNKIINLNLRLKNFKKINGKKKYESHSFGR